MGKGRAVNAVQTSHPILQCNFYDILIFFCSYEPKDRVNSMYGRKVQCSDNEAFLNIEISTMHSAVGHSRIVK